MSPPGGDKDIIPPTIISSYPENGTTFFNENEIELTFSEYVNKRDINDAFFISPLMEKTPEFSWTNTTVEISFKEKFKENTTYNLIIGTEVSDVNNNNKMSDPFILTFSTGNKIDSGKISGKVFADKADGTLIFAYLNKSDTLNIYKTKPDYVSQINKKGEYTIGGLGNGNYELFAVKDEFKDLLYNKGDDKIGIANNYIILSDSSNKVDNINFFLTKEDTLAPTLQAATMTDKNHLIVEFNEPIDSTKLAKENFTIVDSTKNILYNLKSLYKGNPRKNEYVLGVLDSLNIENDFYLIAKNIYDKKQNKLFEESINFTPSDKVDTTAVKISRIIAPLTNNMIYYLSPTFSISFSDAFNKSVYNKGINFYDSDSNTIPIQLTLLDDASIEIKTEQDLKPKKTYKLSVNLNYFPDLTNNKLDTVIVNKINTISSNEFSGASGIVKTNYANVKIVLNSVENKNKIEQRKINPDGKFEFERVMPGNYLLWIFEDSDSNNHYSFGNVDSNKFAETFKFYPDTLDLRPRWPIGDIEIDFNK